MGLVPARRPGWSLEGRGNPYPRGMAAQSRFLKRDGQNPAYRPSGAFLSIRLLANAAAAPYSNGIYGSAKEIGRLGLSPLALLRRQGPVGSQGAPVRPGGLHRNRGSARAQGA